MWFRTRVFEGLFPLIPADPYATFLPRVLLNMAWLVGMKGRVFSVVAPALWNILPRVTQLALAVVVF